MDQSGGCGTRQMQKMDNMMYEYDTLNTTLTPAKTENSFTSGDITIYNADVSTLYDRWDSPVVIVCDGPYGVSGFAGDPPKPEELPAWYEPHIKAWSDKSTPQTTLLFCNTEIGWANVHPVMVKYGWTYRNCHIWNKGIAHIAGNSNTKTLRKFPVVTEVCVDVKEPEFTINQKKVSMQEWLRYEWERSGIPLYKAHEACGVKNAATRKYFTKDHLWYYPPVDSFEKIVYYFNTNGLLEGKPYFSVDGKAPISSQDWGRLRSKFYCPIGVCNVWDEPAVRGSERLKNEGKCIHTNQKPLRLLETIIKASCDEGDLVWEPFGGLCSVAVAAYRLGRRCVSAEINHNYYETAVDRFKKYARDGIA